MGLPKRASWEGGNMEKGRKDGMEKRRGEGEDSRREGKEWGISVSTREGSLALPTGIGQC